MKCSDCKYWAKEENRRIVDVGLCKKAQPLWDCSIWNEKWCESGYNEEFERVLLPEFKDLKMFVYALLTKPDFFCAHFEEK